MRCVRSTASAVFSHCGTVSAAVLPVAKVILAGLLVSACSHAKTAYEEPSNVGMRPLTQVAVVAAPKIELEDDGLAVQLPPRVRKNAEPDDPSEPLSRNYGPAPVPHGAEPVKTPVKPVQPLQQAQDGPAQLRSRITPISPTEQNAIVARAMAEHERRYP